MEYTSYNTFQIVRHTLCQLKDACGLIIEWNKNIHNINDYLCSPSGMQTMAASCMLIESIGEGIKKIDKHLPVFLNKEAPDIPWKEIKGLRDHIAHGYFNLDAEIILDVALNEIKPLKATFEKLIEIIPPNPSQSETPIVN